MMTLMSMSLSTRAAHTNETLYIQHKCIWAFVGRMFFKLGRILIDLESQNQRFLSVFFFQFRRVWRDDEIINFRREIREPVVSSKCDTRKNLFFKF